MHASPIATAQQEDNARTSCLAKCSQELLSKSLAQVNHNPVAC